MTGEGWGGATYAVTQQCDRTKLSNNYHLPKQEGNGLHSVRGNCIVKVANKDIQPAGQPLYKSFGLKYHQVPSILAAIYQQEKHTHTHLQNGSAQHANFQSQALSLIAPVCVPSFHINPFFSSFFLQATNKAFPL